MRWHGGKGRLTWFLYWVKYSRVNRVWLLFNQLCCEESSGKYFKHLPNALFKSHCSTSAPARLPLPGFLMFPFPRWHSWIKPPLAAVTGQLSNPPPVGVCTQSDSDFDLSRWLWWRLFDLIVSSETWSLSCPNIYLLRGPRCFQAALL